MSSNKRDKLGKLGSIHRLRRVRALRPNKKIYESGANQPMDIGCVDLQSGERMDVVVKFNAAERMGPVAASFEILGNILARVWGLWAPIPVLVEITPDFVETMRGLPLYHLASNSIGLNYGSVKVNGLLDPETTLLKEVDQGILQSIFAFDLFIDNADRSKRKPNCQIYDDRILVFDHELCFAFTRIIFS